MSHPVFSRCTLYVYNLKWQFQTYRPHQSARRWRQTEVLRRHWLQPRPRPCTESICRVLWGRVTVEIRARRPTGRHWWDVDLGPCRDRRRRRRRRVGSGRWRRSDGLQGAATTWWGGWWSWALDLELGVVPHSALRQRHSQHTSIINGKVTLLYYWPRRNGRHYLPTSVNPLWAHLNRRARDHYTSIRWLVHWPLMGGLLHLVHLTARQSTASVPTSYHPMWHSKGLKWSWLVLFMERRVGVTPESLWNEIPWTYATANILNFTFTFILALLQLC